MNTYMQNTDQMKALAIYRRNVAAIQADQDLTYVARQRKIMEEQQSSQEQIQRIIQDYQDAADYMRKYTASLIADPKPSGTDEALLYEIQTQKAWQRYRPMLDHKDPVEVIQAAASDPIGLKALKAELPAYVMGTNPHLNGAELVKRTQHINDEINRHSEPFMSDRQKAAKTVAEEVERGVRHLSMSAQFAAKEAQGGERATVVDWDGNIVDVPEE